MRVHRIVFFVLSCVLFSITKYLVIVALKHEGLSVGRKRENNVLSSIFFKIEGITTEAG